MKKIDWSIFEGEEPATCYCRCGEVYVSHAKFHGEVRHSITKENCPRCGSDRNTRRISFGPEKWTLEK
jgi:Zn finger protein HypA/HybF involved in hydrogenase expression